MSRRATRAGAWLALLLATIIGLRVAASGALASPPVASLDQFDAWVDAREPVEVALALVRSVAELAAWYVLALSVLHVLASTFRLRGAGMLADLVATPGTARLVRGGLGLGLVTATALVGDPVARAADPPAPSLIRSAPDNDEPAAATGTATMRPPVGETRGTAWMIPQVPKPRVQEPAVAPASGPSTWRVDRGDSFWSIASDVLERSWQRSPTDREIDPFWRVLVDANRSRLADADDPDLVYPGQVFEIPPVPAVD